MLYIYRQAEVLSVDDQDRIFRTKAGGFDVDMTPSNNWKMLGAVEFQVVFDNWTPIRRYTMAEVREGKVPWKRMDGTQQVYILDVDHGRSHVWTSPIPYYCRSVR
jgi:hypothetical protein